MIAVRRREFLRALVVVATPAGLGACADANPLGSGVTPPEEPGRYFPQSLVSADPRPGSVVLWTRAFDPERDGEDLELVLELATDEAFSERLMFAGKLELALTATSAADGCVKVRVEGLSPDTHYYYRFSYVAGSGRHPSRVGRTRTAPEPDSDRVVSFAVFSCQDYGGKYFHPFRHARDQNLDFFLHLGDYIYETPDDPSFQAPTPERRVQFSRPDEALDLGEGRIAARSLGNYRDLYKTFRSDPDLQRLHELLPMIAVPDDHEFSNDACGASANYLDGRASEVDFERRRNADQAWFEFMPFDDVLDPAFALDREASFPDDLRLYRSFTFGRHLEVVMTDLRRYRPDHVVPEDAFPGSIFMREEEAEEIVGALPDDAVPYIDIDAEEHADLRDGLETQAAAQGFDGARARGLLSVPWINGIFVAAGQEPPLDESARGLPRGYAVHQLAKAAEFSAAGSRYLVAEGPFRAFANLRARDTGGASERLMGDEQRRWFVDTLRASTRTWKVWGNEYTLMQRAIDLSAIPFVPPEYQRRLLLTVEDWDGAPNERNALLGDIAGVENVVVFTGDLHAIFAGTPHPEGNPDARVIEFVCGSVSSTTWLAGMQAILASDRTLPTGAALLAGLIDTLLQHPETKPNPHMGWFDLQRNGYAVVRAGAEELAVEIFVMSDGFVSAPGPALEGINLFTPIAFRVRSGTRDLEQRIQGEYRTWDRDTLSWV